MSETPIAYTQQQMQIAYLRSVISQRDPEADSGLSFREWMGFKRAKRNERSTK